MRDAGVIMNKAVMTEEKLTESVQGEGAMQTPAQKEEKTKIVYEGGGSLDARPGQDGDGVLIDDGRIEAMKEYLSPEELYQDLIARVRRYHPSDDITMIEKAYQVAAKAHEGQVRKSGEPYIIHPLLMACNAVSIGIRDDAVVATILLHDVCEDCGVSLSELPVDDTVRRAVDLMTFRVIKAHDVFKKF